MFTTETTTSRGRAEVTWSEAQAPPSVRSASIAAFTELAPEPAT